MLADRQSITDEIARVRSEEPTRTDPEVVDLVSKALPGVLPEHVEGVINDAKESQTCQE